MKVGDYIICKKDKIGYKGMDVYTEFKKDKRYKVKSVKKTLPYINIENEFGVDKTFNTHDMKSFLYLYDYFHTKEELRDINISEILNNF